MDSGRLKRWQAERLANAVRPALGYLTRLKRRMEKVAFARDDRLFRLVCAAHAAMHRPWVELHYLSCDGVGEPRRED